MALSTQRLVVSSIKNCFLRLTLLQYIVKGWKSMQPTLQRLCGLQHSVVTKIGKFDDPVLFQSRQVLHFLYILFSKDTWYFAGTGTHYYSLLLEFGVMLQPFGVLFSGITFRACVILRYIRYILLIAQCGRQNTEFRHCSYFFVRVKFNHLVVQ